MDQPVNNSVLCTQLCHEEELEELLVMKKSGEEQG